MIKQLNKSQEDQIPLYVDKWVNKGTNTDRLDHEKTLKIVNDYQREILETAETEVIIVDNPIEGWVANVMLSKGCPIEKDQVHDELKAIFADEDRLRLILRANPPVWPTANDGSLYSSAVSFYDFMINEVGVELEKPLVNKYKAWEATTELGLMFPLDDVMIVTQKPTEIHFNENGELHAEGKPAIKYAGLGNFEVYSLNGTRVPKWLALANDGDLNIDQFTSIENAEVRTEFVRKFGVERMLETHGTQLDTFKNYNEKWWTKSEYELWDMATVFEGVEFAPHLKMRNATTGVWHVEAVAPTCENLEDAIRDRFNGRDLRIDAIA